ncbi:hypothetical protein [Butyrivibrio sp. LC3010]|uniref:hypothetical protein n=1 Tax=Butyrivibrio sp. LC3010 TaxID=1280680 RepID=UPI000417019C|nr:hypothetical protein [Butyrivibrio sp. LC3010]
MNLEIKRNEVIKFLRKYNLDSKDYKTRVVLAAPAYGNKNELRVYMNGGNVGKIALNKKGITTGISKKYSNKYNGIAPEAVYILEKNSRYSESDRLDSLIDLNYLKYAQEATTTYSVKSANDSDRERAIETLIMDYRNQKYGNAAIDMEIQYSVKDHFGWTRNKQDGHVYPSTMKYRKHEWFNEEFFCDSDDTKSPRVDLMVLNDAGIGFVELKVDNENCENLSSHIRHMNYILSHPDVFISDADRRLSVLTEYHLIEPEMLTNQEKWIRNHQIWCGLMFVGTADKLDGAKRMIKKELSNIQNIKCCFVDISAVRERRLNMKSDIFISKETFISSEYLGER